MRLSSQIAYIDSERPACLVERDGQWYAGEIRVWRLVDRGGAGGSPGDVVWAAIVSYSTSYDRAFCELLPLSRVRPLSTPDRVWEQPLLSGAR